MRQPDANRIFAVIFVGLVLAINLTAAGLVNQRDEVETIRVESMEADSSSIAGNLETSYPPIILWTDPADGEWDVPPDQSINIKFNESVNQIVTFRLSPNDPPPPYIMYWNEGDTNLTIEPGLFGLLLCTKYTATVIWDDGFGNPLSYSWSFNTVCLPYIMYTDPQNGAMDIGPTDPIIITFSEPMDNSSLVFSLVPSAGILAYQWTDSDRTVIITHSEPFAEMTLYTATVIDARDKDGNHFTTGPVPNPWTFSVASTPFYIISTDPPDGAVDVPQGYPITIVFSEPFDVTSVLVQISPSTTVMPSFPNGQTVVFDHSPFLPCTLVTLFVNAQSLDGDLLIPGPVPNPFHFTTVCMQAPRGLSVHRAPPDDVLLTWKAVPNASYYLVFHSTDKLAPWPWTVIANVATNSATLSGHLSDSLDHFYIVRTTACGGTNSTMGVLWHLHLAPIGGGNSGLWLSLPYNSIYNKASDVSGELGCGKINFVGKWDSSREKLVFRYCMQDQWRGPDFSLLPGEAFQIGVKATFDWAVNGTDFEDPLAFIWRPPPNYNYYWMSLPLTGRMTSASGLVTAIAGGLGPGTNTKIDAIGKWNCTRQAYDFFRYTPTGWSGIDFTLEVGECVWIETTSTFAWAPPLITPEVP